MREIKFRLRIGNKIVGYEKWYEGSFSKTNGQTANPYWLYSKDNKHWNPDFIWHKQKDQYTGLPDKNGKEMCEGDIIKHEFHMGVVVYFEENAKFHVKEKGLTFWTLLPFYWEIVSNIYESPRLLKEENE